MINDALLIERAQADPQQFDAVYERYVDRIFAYAMRELGDRDVAKDITAATFERAYKALPKFKWRSVPISAWLYRIAYNLIQDHRKQQARRLPLFQRLLSKQDVERTVVQREQQAQVRQAMAKLKQRDRDVLRLHYDEDLKAAEIAIVLGCSADNVYVRLHRALKRLKEQVNHEVK